MVQPTNFGLCRDYLRSDAPTLAEYAAWLTLNEQAATGTTPVAAEIARLIEDSTDARELAALAAGPVRELFMAENGGYRVLVEASESSPAVLRVLSALRRYVRNVLATHRALKRYSGIESDAETLSELMESRLADVAHSALSELPMLPQADPRAAADQDVAASIHPSSVVSADLDTLISAAPLQAWSELVAAINAAMTESEILSLSWYLGLLLDSAEDLLRGLVLERCSDAQFAAVLEASGMNGRSEHFIHAVFRAVDGPPDEWT